MCISNLLSRLLKSVSLRLGYTLLTSFIKSIDSKVLITFTIRENKLNNLRIWTCILTSLSAFIYLCMTLCDEVSKAKLKAAECNLQLFLSFLLFCSFFWFLTKPFWYCGDSFLFSLNLLFADTFCNYKFLVYNLTFFPILAFPFCSSFSLNVSLNTSNISIFFFAQTDNIWTSLSYLSSLSLFHTFSLFCSLFRHHSNVGICKLCIFVCLCHSPSCYLAAAAANVRSVALREKKCTLFFSFYSSPTQWLFKINLSAQSSF